jgi:hypothetical protein
MPRDCLATLPAEWSPDHVFLTSLLKVTDRVPLLTFDRSSLFRQHEPNHVRYRIEVLDYGLVRFDRDTELVFQERHRFKYRDGIKDSGGNQCSRISQRRRVLSRQELVKDKGLDSGFDGLFVSHRGVGHCRTIETLLSPRFCCVLVVFMPVLVGLRSICG